MRRYELAGTDELLLGALRAFLVNSTDMVFIKDTELKYRAASLPFIRMAGLKEAGELVGRSDAEVFGGERARLLRELDIRTLKEGVLLERREPMPEAGGRRRFCLTSRYRISDASGAVAGLYGISRDVTAHVELSERNRRLEVLASTDRLTGLLNRDCAAERIKDCLASGKGANNALLFIDLDRFKEVNDRLGHACGDRILAETGARLKETFRRGDVVARVGGDEFIVLLRDVRSCGDVLRRAGRVFDVLPCVETAGGGSRRICCSIGAVMFREGKSFEQLYSEADRAMYRAKAKGHNRIEFHRE